MKKIFIAVCMLVLSSCVNTGHIVSGELIVNDIVKKDMTGKTIILNDDCSPQKVDINIPYCGDSYISNNELCTITPDKKQHGYKIFQVVNEKDALICTMNGYGNCYGNIEYVKNLGANYQELIDDFRVTDSILLKRQPYSYQTVWGQKTITGYEAVTNLKYNNIRYTVDDAEKCSKKEYSYSKNVGASWVED